MPKQNLIRQLWRQGNSVADIARKAGVCRDTVYKYHDADDLSPKVPAKKPGHSKLDPYKPLIDSWLDDDMKNSPKQRHTAKRVHDRLVAEVSADVSISTVERYVKQAKLARLRSLECFLDLEWAPAEAQADFGEADFNVKGTKVRLSFFVLTFPFSNVGLVQVFPGENAECVCQALRNVFEFVGGVPVKIVFDNAAGVGRRVGELARTTELFDAFSAHYGFAYRFCNPYSGNEKGSVENKVGTVRRNMFVPVPNIWDIDGYNSRLLGRCLDFSNKDHWIKGEPEIQLFEEDKFAMLGLPEKPFDCVTYVTRKTDKKGKFSVGEKGRHVYSSSPELARRNVIVGLRATTVDVFAEDGTFICAHKRAYGSAPTDTTNPASQLPTLLWHIGAWENSKVRASLPESLRAHMDSLGKSDLRAELKVMADQVATSGWDATVQAMGHAYAATGRIDEASVAVVAARAESGAVSYDEPTDLTVYDGFMEVGR